MRPDALEVRTRGPWGGGGSPASSSFRTVGPEAHTWILPSGRPCGWRGFSRTHPAQPVSGILPARPLSCS